MRLVHISQHRLKTFVVVFLTGLMVTGLAAHAFADLRIVSQDDGNTQEMLMKGGRVAASMEDGSHLIVDCDTSELTFLTPPERGVYWQGTLKELREGFEAGLQAAMQELQGMSIPGIDFDELFGGGASTSIELRITSGDTETISGYNATHYLVEYRSDEGSWKTYEELWLSRALLQETEAEVGSCFNLAHEMMGELTAIVSFGMSDVGTIVTNPTYLALYEEGFPVRSRTVLEVFGMTIETESEVVAVSRDPVPDEVFAVPSHYRRVHNALELFDM